jgi:hypothetical protein
MLRRWNSFFEKYELYLTRTYIAHTYCNISGRVFMCTQHSLTFLLYLISFYPSTSMYFSIKHSFLVFCHASFLFVFSSTFISIRNCVYLFQILCIFTKMCTFVLNFGGLNLLCTHYSLVSYFVSPILCASRHIIFYSLLPPNNPFLCPPTLFSPLCCPSDSIPFSFDPYRAPMPCC